MEPLRPDQALSDVAAGKRASQAGHAAAGARGTRLHIRAALKRNDPAAGAEIAPGGGAVDSELQARLAPPLQT